MRYFETCPYCGTKLNPGEQCNCIDAQYNALTPENKQMVNVATSVLLDVQENAGLGVSSTKSSDMEVEEFIQSTKSADEDNLDDGLMCIMGLLMYYAETEGLNCPAIRSEFERASKGKIKRVIKWARGIQSRFGYPEDLDELIIYLRREFLHRDVRA